MLAEANVRPTQTMQLRDRPTDRYNDCAICNVYVPYSHATSLYQFKIVELDCICDGSYLDITHSLLKFATDGSQCQHQVAGSQLNLETRTEVDAAFQGSCSKRAPGLFIKVIPTQV